MEERRETLEPEIPRMRDYLDELEKFLESDEAPAESMLVSELDGYLTGLAVSPVTIPQDEWMLGVWNGETPVFANEVQEDLVLSAILRRFNEIKVTLAVGKWQISPIYWESDEEEGVFAEDWAEGFMAAVRLRFDDWEPLLEHPKDSEILFPILALCSDENGRLNLEDAPDPEKLRKAVPDLIPLSVEEVYLYWQNKVFIPKPIRKVAIPGRNELCPCGSGKKYKRCCGA